MSKSVPYLPILRFRWLIPLYDPWLKWVMGEEIFKRQLVLQSNIRPNMQVMDLGCGIGTLTLMIQRVRPGAKLTGLDGDPQVLKLARETSGAMNIRWDG